MFRRQHHKSGTVKRVGTCCVNSKFIIASVDRKINLSTVALADPVCLHLDDLLRPVKGLQIVQKPVSIRGDPEHPLPQILLCDDCTAALAFTVNDFLVGKSGFTGRAPVDREFFLVG